MDIDADMAASSRPRNGLAEKLVPACPECLLRLGDCTCGTCTWPECDCPSRSCGGAAYTMRESGLFEMPNYRDLPPAKEPVWPVWLLCAALVVGMSIGYFARGWFS